MTINDDPIPANTLIKQWTDGAVKVDANGVKTVTEKWKGQFTHCQTIAMALNAAQTPTGADMIKYDQFTAVAGTLSSSYAMPAPPTGKEWILQNAQVEEIEAGIHGILTLTWVGSSLGAGGEGMDNIIRSETWSLDWQSETYDVYAYCANSPSDPNKANRANIEAVFNNPSHLNNLKKDYKFVNELGEVKALNASEKAIYDKKAQGKGPLMHYPVITHTISYSNVLSSQVQTIFSKETIDLPDYKKDNVSGSPFDLKAYKYVTEGTSVSQTISNAQKKASTITFSSRYIGALSVDLNFYGSGNERWKFGDQ